MKIPHEFPVVKLSEEGERMLQEGLDDLEAGRVKSFDNVEDLIADLHRSSRIYARSRRRRGRGRITPVRPGTVGRTGKGRAG